MASFVTEVLASSGKLEKEDLSGKISKMSRKVEDTKAEVCDLITRRYSEFLSSLQRSEELMVKVSEVSKEMESLKNCIETEVRDNIHVAVADYATLKQKLDRNSKILAMLEHLKDFHNANEDYSRALQEKKYVTAAQQLQKMQGSVESLKSWRSPEMTLPKTLGFELTVLRENLIYHLGDEWKGLVVWKVPSARETANMESFVNTELRLTQGGGEEEDKAPAALICSVLQALAIQGELQHKIKLFSQVLLKNILKPLVVYPTLELTVSEQLGEGTTLALQCGPEESREEHSSPSKVYSKLLLVFRTLHVQLLNVSVGEKKVSAILGELVWEELCHSLIHDCLVYSIPVNITQLDGYGVVIKETEDFEMSLKEMGYLQGDSTELLQYARNVNCHFANKKCRDVIVAARKLMTSKMHDTVKITPDSQLPLPKLPRTGQKGQQKAPTRDEVILENEKQLSDRTLGLPACRISTSVQELMELALTTMSEAVGSSKQCSIQLFFTVRDVFQLFLDVVPTYHKENLLKFPHLSAVQHNNCMYLAHHLLTLGHQFRSHLPPPLSDGVTTFVDMVPALRKLGAQCFLSQLNVQRAEILERLSNARNFSNLDDADNYSAASKAVRQVLHQLKQLGSVWQDVLPVSIHCKAMGTLLNTVISEVMGKIMSLEDISSEDGEHLHTLCQTLIDEGPLVFTPLPEENKNRKYQEEVPLYVRRWMAFKELVIVLRANLQEIVNRWAEGKGPLAMEFSSAEMRSLIRALFQNTERRAVALAKIT